MAFTLIVGAIACGARTPRGDENVALRVDTPAAPKPAADSAPPPPATRAPRIDRIVPDSARVSRGAVAEVVIEGVGFTPGPDGHNTIELGPIRLTLVPANAAGTSIRVVVPERVPSATEAPPMRLMPGTYQVTVTTSAGSSNAMPIRILP